MAYIVNIRQSDASQATKANPLVLNDERYE
jgi:hypothetical protein